MYGPTSKKEIKEESDHRYGAVTREQILKARHCISIPAFNFQNIIHTSK